MPRSVLLTTLTLVLVAAVLGFIAGQRWQPLNETQVISRIAAQYVAETGGAETDCVAVPARHQDIWLRITCGDRTYYVDLYGRLVPPLGPET